MQYPLLEGALNDIAVITTTFETLDLFPAEDPVRADMLEIVFDAQHNLIRRFQNLREGLEANQAAYQLDSEKLKQCVLAMMKQGYPGRSLNKMIKLKAFDEGEMLYYNWVPGLADLEVVRSMPALKITMLLFVDMLERVQDRANFADGTMFRLAVFQKYIAILFLCYATTDPKFYGIG